MAEHKAEQYGADYDEGREQMKFSHADLVKWLKSRYWRIPARSTK
jgi:hypothetical protein